MEILIYIVTALGTISVIGIVAFLIFAREERQAERRRDRHGAISDVDRHARDTGTATDAALATGHYGGGASTGGD